MKRATLTTIAMCLALFACDKPSETTEQPAKPAATTATTATPATTATETPTAQTNVAIAETDLATPADFEEAAEKSITAKTYKAELASIEKDMSKDVN